ncbi:MAG TPA: GDP-mannose 4,6-dehydratase [Gemmatimonadales bacterium]|nr:GDP-mannose 4,6-dehydratase [Gemmatimonadales bacterium]
MRILLTGADGFVGGWLARRLLQGSNQLVGTHRRGGGPSPVLTPLEAARIEWRELEITQTASVESASQGRWDAVVHLAALSSGSEARQDPGRAWEVNAGGTARLAETLGLRVATRQGDPNFLLVSTGEVYGSGRGLHPETDPTQPCSPYAGSKLGAEVAALEVARRTGLRVLIARPFPHTGPGQDIRFVVPALASRIMAAKRIGSPTIKTGSLDSVRDFLDVRDVVEAYVTLLERGSAGQIYNIASGEGLALTEVLRRLERLTQWKVQPELEPRLARRSDLTHLVGDAGKLRKETGWRPQISFDQTLTDLLNAQAN